MGRADIVRAFAIGAMSFAALLLTPHEAATHELNEASATLIVRSGGHLELRLQVPWAEVLRQRWMPRVAPHDALVRIAAMRMPEFARQLALVEREIERGLLLISGPRVGTPFTTWQWPPPESVHAALKTELMSRLAVGPEFEHASRLPAAAEAVVGENTAEVRVTAPPVLGPTLFTAYRPVEQWLPAGGTSSAVQVRRP